MNTLFLTLGFLLLTYNSKAENIKLKRYNEEDVAKHVCITLAGLMGMKEGTCRIKSIGKRYIRYNVDLKPLSYLANGRSFIESGWDFYAKVKYYNGDSEYIVDLRRINYLSNDIAGWDFGIRIKSFGGRYFEYIADVRPVNYFSYGNGFIKNGWDFYVRIKALPDKDFVYMVDLNPKKITDFKKFQPTGLKNGIYSIKGITPEYVWKVASIFTEEQKREICKSIADVAYKNYDSADVAYKNYDSADVAYKNYDSADVAYKNYDSADAAYKNYDSADVFYKYICK